MDLDQQRIVPIDIEDEMKKSFISYAMAVITIRALPDVRDGLKPVHRRILYAMHELGMTPDKPFRKSARIVGDVLGKYHPHGDSAVYDSMVRMAQDFSTRYILVEGHGNFGSIDGDAPAAMRYTEARLSRISMEMLADIDKETVDFYPNFDETLQQPTVLPARFPNLLVNGSGGIAVGMATNIPPHNFGEVIDGVVALIDNPDISIDELNEYIKGPDFPTGGIIMGREGIREAYHTGRGKVIIRGKTEIEQITANRARIVVTEIPYQVNKSRLVEKIGELVREKRIDGISDLRDESDRNGMRIVIELKRDVNANVVLNLLFKHTQLQETFGVIMLALVDGEPKVLNLKQVLHHYLEHQKDVIIRRTRYDLNRAEARAHILEGLIIALDHIDEVIRIIRSSQTAQIAREGLIKNFNLSEKQAQAILDMRLQRLTGLEREKIEEEYKELQAKIEYYRSVLANESMVLDIIKKEILEIKAKYNDERRSQITSSPDEIHLEDLIQEEDVVVTLTHFGYVKRLPIDTYRSQRRGGKGIIGLSTREDDFVEHILVSSTHQYIAFFTNFGKVYRLKAYEIPEAGRQAKGTAIVNLLQLDGGEKITAVIPIKADADREESYLVMVTRHGQIKKTELSGFQNIRNSGLIAIKLRDGDELMGVLLTDGNEELILGTRNGLSIRFHERDVRAMGRTAQGVKAIDLREDDAVVGVGLIRQNAQVLVISEKGYGKRTPIDEYRTQSRGGKGILTLKVTEKTGFVAGLKVVTEEDDIMLISSDGTIIRLDVREISSISRNTQGVMLMRLEEDDSVVSVARVDKNGD
ncbi:MAG: DNA gyrase subunit A [Clostridia bacterium]